jgi:hypothetical protein
VDLVSVAECLPHMDSVRVPKAFARILRPGGTLVIWLYENQKFLGVDKAVQEGVQSVVG